MFLATFEAGGYKVPKSKKNNSCKWRSRVERRQQSGNLYKIIWRETAMFYSICFFLFLNLSFPKFWSEWFTENQRGLTKRLQTMVSKKPWIPLFYLFLLMKLAIIFNLSKPKFLYLQSGDNIHLAKLLWELKTKYIRSLGIMGSPRQLPFIQHSAQPRIYCPLFFPMFLFATMWYHFWCLPLETSW